MFCVNEEKVEEAWASCLFVVVVIAKISSDESGYAYGTATSDSWMSLRRLPTKERARERLVIGPSGVLCKQRKVLRERHTLRSGAATYSSVGASASTGVRSLSPNSYMPAVSRLQSRLHYSSAFYCHNDCDECNLGCCRVLEDAL